jgi:hypothetical protein
MEFQTSALCSVFTFMNEPLGSIHSSSIHHSRCWKIPYLLRDSEQPERQQSTAFSAPISGKMSFGVCLPLDIGVPLLALDRDRY